MRRNSSQEQGKSEETEAKDIEEKLKRVDVKPSSATSLLAKNAVLLPSGVARVKQLQEPRAVSETGPSSSGSATGNPRNKTALAPGHSLMDWIRLGNSGVDLTGVGGVPRVVTMSELARHNKRNDAWVAVRGIVFNVTRYMDFHPGGVNELMRGVGKDATKLFDSVHAWVNYQSILQKCVVGRLNRGSVSGGTSSPTKSVVSTTTYCSPATLSLIRSCTTVPVRTISQGNLSDSGLSNIKLNWEQTSNSITLFYQTLRDYPAVSYQLSMLSNTKLAFKLLFENDIITHQLELTAKIQWPPVCVRDFNTMDIDFTFPKQEKEIWKSQGSQTISKEKNANTRTYKEYEVVANKPLNKFVHMLVVRAKNYMQVVPISRHIELKMTIKGTEVSRMYTPVPPCLHPDNMAPNYKCDCLCLIIKKYSNGALSPSATALQIGQTFLMSNAVGAFVVENFSRYTVVHLLAGGAGLTAMLGVAQWALARQSVTAINLLIFNKNEDNMFYVAELEKATTNPKFKVTHILSEAESTWKGKRGTLSDSLLKELGVVNVPNACTLVCGPGGFLDAAKTSLDKDNWKEEQVYIFEN
ncbi:unnamed protein product [Xylocopa violacea]|uniref:Cytochrome b5 heme-binding domain-containing protein n=2 Tax=Xylocopa violacea TaxID=135666 RepID=A0ABP1P5E7_XYLVO